MEALERGTGDVPTSDDHPSEDELEQIVAASCVPTVKVR